MSDADAKITVTDKDGEPIQGASLNADGSVTLALMSPIPIEGTTTSAITIRRPKGRDLRALDGAKGAGLGASMQLIARLAALPPSSIDEMDGSDVAAAAQVIDFFSRRSPATGAS